MITARKTRVMRFAEVVGRYAAQRRIGLHPALVIEQRNTCPGVGLFVRNAVSSSTPLLVLPCNEAITTDSLRLFGPTTIPTVDTAPAEQSVGSTSVISALLSCSTKEWIELSWLLSIDAAAHRARHWGWLGSVARNYDEEKETAATHCRSGFPEHYDAYCRLSDRVEDELLLSWTALQKQHVCAPFKVWRWSVFSVLARSTQIPTVDQSAAQTALLPLVDFANFGDSQLASNAQLELMQPEELPTWYRDELEDMGDVRRSTNADSSSFYVALSLREDLLDSSEVRVDDPLLWGWQESYASLNDADGNEERVKVLYTLLRYQYCCAV